VCRGNNEEFLLRCTKFAEKRRWGHLVQAFHAALAKVAAVPEGPKASSQPQPKQQQDAAKAGAGSVPTAAGEVGEGVPSGEQGGGQQRESKRRKVASSAKQGGAEGGEGPAAAELRMQVCCVGWTLFCSWPHLCCTAATLDVLSRQLCGIPALFMPTLRVYFDISILYI